MTRILSSILAVFIFLICAYNGQKLIAQADGDTVYSYGIAFSVALLFTLLFLEGKKRFLTSQPNGLIFMLVVVFCEVAMGFFLTQNISKHEIKGISKPFAPDSLQIAQVFTARTDSFRSSIAKQSYINRAALAKLKPNQTTEKAAARQRIDKFSLDSSEKVAAINSRFLLCLKDKKEQIDTQNEAGIGDALDTKKAANNAIAFANILLYLFLFLLSKKENIHEKEISIFYLLKTKLYRQSDLLAEIKLLKNEVLRLTPFEEQAEKFRLEVELFGKQLETTGNKVENISKNLAETSELLKIANNKYNILRTSLEIYLNAAFTINNNYMIWLFLDNEGKLKHDKVGKSGWKNKENLDKLEKRLGFELDSKLKKEAKKMEDSEISHQEIQEETDKIPQIESGKIRIFTPTKTA